MLTNLSGGKAVEGECTTFFQRLKFLCFWELNFEKLMGHSPIDLHTHDMLVFFLHLVVGPELAPPVHVDFSLPVLYLLSNFYIQNQVAGYPWPYWIYREDVFGGQNFLWLDHHQWGGRRFLLFLSIKSSKKNCKSL